MKIEDIIQKMTEEKQKEVEATVRACMESICCEEVKWKEFSVYDSSADTMKKILENLSIEFLLPISDKAKQENGREVIIFCNATNEKEDDIWFVRVKSNQLHATINLSAQTITFLNKEKKE